MKIAVVTDSTAYLTKEEYAEYGIYVLPMSVIFGQETYREEIDITAEEFYAKVKSSPVFPTSTQPAVGETYELFRELAKIMTLLFLLLFLAELVELTKHVWLLPKI